jgi:hypothetical protein
MEDSFRNLQAPHWHIIMDVGEAQPACHLVQQPKGNFPLSLAFFFFSLLIIDLWESHYRIQVGLSPLRFLRVFNKVLVAKEIFLASEFHISKFHEHLLANSYY